MHRPAQPDHSPSGIRSTVRLFAILRDRAGVSTISFNFHVGTTVADAVFIVGKTYPIIEPLLSHISFAVNQEFVFGDAVLLDGDELALIPPVSGG